MTELITYLIPLYSLQQGETGAATSVTHWTDPLTGTSYPGFPYTVWSESEAKQEIRTAKAIV